MTAGAQPPRTLERMARDAAPDKPKRLAQIRQTYRMTRRSDPRIGWLTLGIFVAVLAVFVALGLLFGTWWLWLLFGVPMALLASAVFFGRRAEKAAYKQIEGQPGSAAAALGTLRRGWIVSQTPVAVTRNQDMVFRVLGRPGIILIGEGQPQRVRQLLAQERKRHTRVAYEVTVHEVVVGSGPDEVPLRRLVKHVTKLPRSIAPAEVTELNNRLRALSTMPVPVPKGPLPKNVRMPKGGFPRT